MEKKNLEKKSPVEWECPKGCIQTKEPCPHLESLITPKTKWEDRSVKATPYGAGIEREGENFSYGYTITEEDKWKFITKLKEYGMGEHEIKALYAQFVDNCTLSTIAEEQNFVDPRTVGEVIKRALTKLKERKFK